MPFRKPFNKKTFKQDFKNVLFASAFIFLFSLLLHQFFSFLHADNYNYRKTHLFSYYFLTGSLIRNMPQPSVTGEAEFYSRPSEGTKMGRTGVRFCSSASKEAIVETLNQYAVENGFTREGVGFYSDREYGYVRHDESAFQFDIDKYDCGADNWNVTADKTW
jgi:hypothetical protein